MPKNKEIKSKEIVKLEESLKATDGVVFADFSKISTEKMRGLKNALLKLESTITVSKNTLINKALAHLNKPTVELAGPTAMVFLKGDVTLGLKEIFKFKKETELLGVKLGILDNKTFNSQEIEKISKLPSRLELLAKVVGGFNSPISGLVGTLSGVQRKFVYTIDAIKKLKS